MAETRKGGRKATGQLFWKASGWYARYWAVIDGERVRVKRALGTTNKSVAKAKLARLLAGDRNADAAAQTETLSEAIERLVERQRGDGFKTAKERLSRLQRFVPEHIMSLSIDAVRASHVREVLDGANAAGKSRQTVMHIRNDLSAVLGDLFRDEQIDENPMARVKLPKKLKQDKRPRVSPTDAEFARFMACAEIGERLHLMALTSRAFGGMRTSDLHAWDWSHVDTKTFAVAKVYRPKTDGDDEDGSPGVLEELIVPDVLRAPLVSWWTRYTPPPGSRVNADGRPLEGPVFPRTKGKRAGERQGKRSHARALRRGFWLAGVHRPLPGFDDALKALRAAEKRLADLSQKGEGREVYREALKAWKRTSEAAKALDAVQTNTTNTKCLDFHSLRRSYNTALARAGVNVQQAMALAGHRNPSTHVRYVQLSQHGPLEQPAAALPMLPPANATDEKALAGPFTSAVSGDPSESRTRVTGVRGRCPNH